jgi:hypothetical protein
MGGDRIFRTELQLSPGGRLIGDTDLDSDPGSGYSDPDGGQIPG